MLQILQLRLNCEQARIVINRLVTRVYTRMLPSRKRESEGKYYFFSFFPFKREEIGKNTVDQRYHTYPELKFVMIKSI